jgi:outer membrane protein TolC
MQRYIYLVGLRGAFSVAVRVACVLALACAAKRPVTAQAPSQQQGTLPTAPTPVPLSGRAPGIGTVTVTQQTAPGAGPGGSVNVIQPDITVQPPWSGSMPNEPLSAGPMTLTLDQALVLGMKYNLGAIAQSAAVMQARGERAVARSQLMPNLNGAGSEVLSRINLRAQGVETDEFPSSATFNYFDVRVAKLQQTVFDLVSIQNLHSASATLGASMNESRNARDLIVLAVGGSYLRLIATRARIAAAAAQVETARAVYKQADDRFAAGLAPRIDATRSKVQLQTEMQSLRSQQGDFETQKLSLSRIIGLATGQKFDVTDENRYTPLTGFDLDGALKEAFDQRYDLQAAASGVHAGEAALKAARAERLPNIKISADVGLAGLRPTKDTTGVYNFAGTVTVPIYEGGRIHGDIEQAEAALKQRKAEMEDLRGQVDQDVRQAFINLNTAADQVEVAKSNVDLSHETLNQSRDRFAAGIADTVEVVQAEQAVVQADSDYITAVFEHNLAKVSLARAMGHAEQTLPQLMKRP